MAKIHIIEENYIAFHCPGCGNSHGVTINGRRNASDATWTWNGNFDKPTFNPSVHCIGYCHSTITDGMITFDDNDTKHNLKGKTVEIPEWE